MEYFILPAIKQDQPLPPNQEMVTQIKQLSHQMEYPDPKQVKPLPAIAKQISDKVFVCDPNDFGFKSFSLVFGEGAECLWTPNDIKTHQLPVGLDGLFRYSESNGVYQTICRGNWKDDQTFIIEWQNTHEAGRRNFEFIFSDNQVQVFCQNTFNWKYRGFKGKILE